MHRPKIVPVPWHGLLTGKQLVAYQNIERLSLVCGHERVKYVPFSLEKDPPPSTPCQDRIVWFKNWVCWNDIPLPFPCCLCTKCKQNLFKLQLICDYMGSRAFLPSFMYDLSISRDLRENTALWILLWTEGQCTIEIRALPIVIVWADDKESVNTGTNKVIFVDLCTKNIAAHHTPRLFCSSNFSLSC